ncbi:MAG TPA: tRNA (guanosine(37)-N1)-methyltransferase TrmD [Luteimonas sp.]
MRFDIVSLFPDFVSQVAGHGVVGRAADRGLLSIHGWNPRDHAEGNYRRVDDRPFGGGPGMVMLVDPLRTTLAAVRAADPAPVHVVYMSPQGRRFDQAAARRLAGQARLVLLCGRYEGVDERLLQAEVDEEISIGDYVLSGGELAAAVVVDAVARLLPGALNDVESAAQDSFEAPANGEGPLLLDCPHYTRPVEHALGAVPPVLLSGNHALIARWRRQQSLVRTWLRRPDLIDLRALGAADRRLLDEGLAEAGHPPAGREAGDQPAAGAGGNNRGTMRG